MAGAGEEEVNQVIAAARRHLAGYGSGGQRRTSSNYGISALNVLKAWVTVTDEASKSRYGGRHELAWYVFVVTKEQFDSALLYKEMYLRLNPNQKLIICILKGFKTWATTAKEDHDCTEVPAAFAFED